MLSVAQTLRRLLEAEGAIIHPSLRALPLSKMGGGMGMIASERIESTTTLAILPSMSLLTIQKARWHLALAEIALQGFTKHTKESVSSLRREQRQGFTAMQSNFFHMIDNKEDEESNVSSKCLDESYFQDLVQETMDNLKEQLSPTETMTSYIVLMASLYRNVNSKNTIVGTTLKFKEETNTINSERCNDDSSVDNSKNNSISTPRFCNTSENAWMRDWMNVLPGAYDNLLELSNGFDTRLNTTDNYLQGFNKLSSEKSDLQISPLWFARHRAKVAYEQAEFVKRYQHCLDVLLCLKELPIGVNEEYNEAFLTRDNHNHYSNNCKGKLFAFAQKGVSCTLDQFLWAFNTLMSRGFAFEEEVWVMMPWVDYFNYALHANCTMYAQRCKHHKINNTNDNDPECEFSISSDDEIVSNPSDSSDCLKKEGSVVRSSPTKGWEYVFQATSSIEAGEQVCISYGSYSDFECLLWYGFIQRPYLLPTSVLPSEPPRDFQSFFLFPNTRTAQIFLRKMGVNVEELSHLHAAIPRLQEECFRQTTFEGFWKHHMAFSTSDNKLEGKFEYKKWKSALQKAFAFVFSPFQDAEGGYLDPHKGATWINELVNHYLNTPPISNILAFGNLSDKISIFKDKITYLDKGCRCFAEYLQFFLRGQISNSLRIINTASSQKCTLGVFGASFAMQEWIQCIARECRNQLKSKKKKFHSRSEELLLLLLPSLQDAKLFVLRAIAWMELYSNYSSYEHYFQAEGSTVNTKESFTTVYMSHISSDNEGRVFFSVESMSLRASLDAWLLLQYLALEANDVELLSYLHFESD
ncbi:unnamed protein product [Phytomonas sp. Hart1]|nr:unnamed protein product [Phytomonas sp. Hart1]|eukprot:CCW71679.1 unnamed protein product [Phytomonas sp. isolate Hart1]